MSQIKVIITGSTGMVGKGVLLECLENEQVEAVLAINRQSIGLDHPKLAEIIHKDYYDWNLIRDKLSGFDACFFCLGVSAMGMSEPDYTKVTYDLTVGFAKVLEEVNQDLTFCYVSGAGTDSSERGRSMWARVKGRTENALLQMGLGSVYLFRPGYIQPMGDIKSKTKLYNAIYFIFKPLYPILKAGFPNYVTSTALMGKAMVNVALKGYSDKYLENKHINHIASS